MNDTSDNIIIVTACDTTAETVSQAFEDENHLSVMARYHEIDDLDQHFEKKPVAALVDIDPMPGEILTKLTPLVAKLPNTCFVILCSNWDEELVLRAMAIGARHFMRKSSVDSDLVNVIHRLLSAGKAVSSLQGEVITVLSAGGGCGATTLAVNLANELHLAEDKPVLLVDLDIAYGSIGRYLDISGKYGVADIIGNGKVIDGNLVASSAIPYSKDLHVLLSPASVDFSGPRELKYEKIGKFINACRQNYAFTIIDAPRVSPSVAADLAAASKATLVVMQLSVKDVQVARELRESLLDSEIAGENIFPVINRYRKKGWSVSLAEVQQAVGSDNTKLVSNDYRPASRSIDLGGPLAKTSPRSSLRKDIQKLLIDMSLRSETEPGGRP